VSKDPKQGGELSFKDKLKTLHFGVVPGAYRQTSSRTYYDRDSLPNFPTKEEVMDHQSDYRSAPIKELKLDAETGRPEEDSGS
jgi:hypothetical protein